MTPSRCVNSPQEDLGSLDRSLSQLSRPGAQQLYEESRLQQGEVAFQCRLRQGHRSRQVGEVQQSARASGHYGEQTWNGGRVGNVCQIPYIPLEHRRNVGLKPGIAASRALASYSRRIASINDALQQFFPGHGGRIA